MRKKFWNFVHNRLEDAWHWVYYHKLADPPPCVDIGHKDYRYTFTYVCGKTGMISDPSPVIEKDVQFKKLSKEESIS